jgi:uncharacterized membrane protein (DUF106 family)
VPVSSGDFLRALYSVLFVLVAPTITFSHFVLLLLIAPLNVALKIYKAIANELIMGVQ